MNNMTNTQLLVRMFRLFWRDPTTNKISYAFREETTLDYVLSQKEYEAALKFIAAHPELRDLTD